MNELKIFKYEETDIRTLIIKDETWWVARDICNILELNNISESLKRIDEEDLSSEKLMSGGQLREMKIINESGLYALIMTSTKPEAKQFKRWITHEVLPTIRKTGGYISNSDLMVNTYFGNLDDTYKVVIKGLFDNIEIQQKQLLEKDNSIKELNTTLQHKQEIILDITESVPAKTMRSAINQIVRNGGKNFSQRYGLLYTEFSYRYGVNLKIRADHRKISTIQYADDFGYLRQLYELCTELFEADYDRIKHKLLR